MSAEMQGSILVTGAAGFIGSHVCEALTRKGVRIIGIDNFDPYYDRAVKERNLAEVRATAGNLFSFIEMNICDADAVRKLFAEHRFESVIHLAAKAGVRPSIEDPTAYAMTNVYGTSVLMEAAHKNGVKRFVMASSSSVYGNHPTVPFNETLDVNQPISPYAATKRSCEMIAHAHWHITKMPTACLRFFTVFGPRQRPDLAIHKFLRLVSSGKAITLFGDGSTSRDYTYIDDIVNGILGALGNIDRFGYRIWNLGGSSPVSLSELVDTVSRVTGQDVQIDRQPMQPGDVERTYADLARSREEIGYAPTISIEEGIRRQWEWMQTTGPSRSANLL